MLEQIFQRFFFGSKFYSLKEQHAYELENELKRERAQVLRTTVF